MPEGQRTSSDLTALAVRIGASRSDLLTLLGIARSTFYGRMRAQRPLSPGHSARLNWVMDLIRLTEKMVVESGDPTNFAAAPWLWSWLQQPMPALGNRRPADFAFDEAGRELVLSFLARAQSGAYS
jgi:putative toxin-antitoxin system antitoxin component (TIGR02293 family)